MKKVESIFIFLIIAGVSLVSVEMVYAQTPTIYMQDTTASFGLSTHSGRQIHAEYVTGSSVLVGKQIDTIIIKLKKVGLPTGNVEIGIFNKDLSEKKIFATKDVSKIARKYTDYTFSLSSPGQPYQIQTGDRIGIKYSGGDATNYVAIMTDQNTSGPFDGTNSFHTYSTASGWNIYNTHDLYMTLELVTPPTNNCQNSPIAAVTAIGSDGNIPANAIDGNLTTRWSNLGVGSWINLDLGAQKTICNVDIAWYNGNLRSNNFVISTSTDGNTFTGVYAGSSNGTTASFENYDFADVTARYVMITVNGNAANNWASIGEINVDAGSPPTSDTTPPTVSASPAGGTYSTLQSVTVTASEPSTIYYTIDGTMPDTLDAVYTSPISIGTSTTLKFFAKDTAGNIGIVVTQVYTINISAPPPPPPPPPSTNLRLDSAGVQMFYAQEVGRQSFVSENTDPNTQPGVRLDAGSPALPKVQCGFL